MADQRRVTALRRYVAHVDPWLESLNFYDLTRFRQIFVIIRYMCYCLFWIWPTTSRKILRRKDLGEVRRPSILYEWRRDQ